MSYKDETFTPHNMLLQLNRAALKNVLRKELTFPDLFSALIPNPMTIVFLNLLHTPFPLCLQSVRKSNFLYSAGLYRHFYWQKEK